MVSRAIRAIVESWTRSASTATSRRVKQLAVVLGRLDRERMISDSEAMTVALERDLIDPGDFCR